ncbi:cobalamin B12-binding domain-containing protein [Paenibacillus frigoriresistens]|nr:cobalamin B12-binding domain-containing protein [Paenibacillus frigoriresistens]
MLNIPSVTIRAWENRYQIVRPIRSSGGHRLYTDANLDTLRWVKQQMEERNLKISEAVGLLKQKSSGLPREKDSDVQATLSNALHELIEKLYLDLISLNTANAHCSMDLAFSLYHHNVVFHNILAPILYRIGTEWEDGNISVAQEHFSSQLIMQRCSQFLRILPTQPLLPKVLSACPEGEHHHMGLMLFSLFLRNKGMEITYMGPNTPLHDLLPLISMKNIGVVTVSITDPGNASKIEEWVELCRQQFPNVKVVLGGTGVLRCKSPISRYVLSGDQDAWEDWFQSTIVVP